MTRISGAFSMPGFGRKGSRLIFVSHGNEREALQGTELAETERGRTMSFDGVNHLVDAVRPEIGVRVQCLGGVLVAEHQLHELHVRARRDGIRRGHVA